MQVMSLPRIRIGAIIGAAFLASDYERHRGLGGARVDQHHNAVAGSSSA